jgi:hypothetical protein
LGLTPYTRGYTGATLHKEVTMSHIERPIIGTINIDFGNGLSIAEAAAILRTLAEEVEDLAFDGVKTITGPVCGPLPSHCIVPSHGVAVAYCRMCG